MKGRKIPILPILLMCALVAAGYGIYKNVEFEEVEYSVGYSEEARSNRFLAAGRLLESEGFTFDIGKDRSVFSALDIGSTGVLWMRDINVLEDEREAKQMLAWIRSGGILLTSSVGDLPFGKSTVPGWLMAELGVKKITKADEESDKFRAAFHSDSYFITIPDEGLKTQRFNMSTEVDPYFKTASTLPDDSRTLIISSSTIFFSPESRKHTCCFG